MEPVLAIIGGVLAALLTLILTLLYKIMGRLARLETLWGERDRSAAERRADWLREAEKAADDARKADIREHEDHCPGRRAAGGTNPRIARYDPEPER